MPYDILSGLVRPQRDPLRRFEMFSLFAVAVVLLFLLSIAPAAADPVSLAPVYSWGNEFIFAVLSILSVAFVAWAMWAFHTKISPFLTKYVAPAIIDRLEQKAAVALNVALQNGIAIAMNKLEGVEQQHLTVDLKNEMANTAAGYALKFAPDAVAKFGLTPEDLALKALAFIPVAPATTLGTTGSADPVKPVEQRGLPPLS